MRRGCEPSERRGHATRHPNSGLAHCPRIPENLVPSSVNQGLPNASINHSGLPEAWSDKSGMICKATELEFSAVLV